MTILSQLSAVEFQIINRVVPLSATTRGRTFIRDAEEVFQRLDNSVALPDSQDR